MNETDLLAEIKKLKFQVRLLGTAIGSHEHPIAGLVVEMDWSEADLEAAHDIFEEASKTLDECRTPDYGEFERKLKGRFGISYQGIKPIVLAFYRNHQWADVCEWYVKAGGPNPPLEFDEITRAIAQREAIETWKPGGRDRERS